ncbi:hypothetical protein [Thermococcus nautili]|uniref:hypothetical protein n=1 Tax=Thermococcus nautili TaxID=195522 RepID=UPI00255562DB|nr:hypothetical protein [Thermococcus nautili]
MGDNMGRGGIVEETKTIRLSKSAYELLNSMKRDLRVRLRRSVFYSDIITTGVALISAFEEVKPGVISTLMGQKGVDAIEVAKRELGVFCEEQVRKEVREIIHLLLNEGFPEASMKVLMMYQHVFDASERNELAFRILEKLRGEG